MRTEHTSGERGRAVRRGVTGLLVVGVMAAVVSTRDRPAEAGPTPPGADPRLWAQKDMRLASRDEITTLTAKFALLCGLDPGRITGGMLQRAANRTTLPGQDATLLACVAGAPTQATCAQLQQCTGLVDGDPGPETSQCDGGLLRTRGRQGQGQGATHLVTLSCQAQGETCYQGPITAMCGIGTCNDLAPYRCDGDSIVACVEGIQQRTPCGRGMTCGESPGSHALDCIGRGQACTGGARCDGDTMLTCQRDSWGKGFEQPVSCADFGLTCQQGQNDKGQNQAVCVPTKTGDCGPQDAASCDGGQVQMCIANHKTKLSCAQLGLPGACSVVAGKPSCQ